MKQRLLIMNGSRIVQNETNGEWETQKVEKANGVKPGIYNLYLSNNADKTKNYTGIFVHSDKSSIYQQVGKEMIVHNRDDFGKDLPDVGEIKAITYDGLGKAIVADAEAISLKRGLKR
jgi:KfrB protein